MNRISGLFQLIENWKIERVDEKTNLVLDTEEFCNNIVNDGLEAVAKLLNGESSSYFRALAVGTGTTAVTNTDTTLETEVQRELATLSYEASYKAKFYKEFTFSGSYSITEAGIFDSDTVSGSLMLARSVFSAKEVSTTVKLRVTALITVSRV